MMNLINRYIYRVTYKSINKWFSLILFINRKKEINNFTIIKMAQLKTYFDWLNTGDPPGVIIHD